MMCSPKRSSSMVYAVLILLASIHSANAAVFNVIDINPDPNVFEAELSADEHLATIDGTSVQTLIYKDLNQAGGFYSEPTDGVPIPQIVIDVGDEVIITLTNDFDDPCDAIACDTSIHWHGLELDFDSDGTGVTQNAVLYGESYTYRFIAPRPGVFWFHPHMLPGPQTLAGTYGAFIVRDPDEASLIADGKVPASGNTHTIVLTDIEFDGGGEVGLTWNDDGDDGTTAEVFERWAVLKNICADTGNNFACKAVADGDTVVINGSSSAPIIKAKSGAGIRLRLINPSTNRYFRLGVEDNGVDDATDNNLYRIGGEGGFLEHARLEGGVLGTWDTEYASGEILVSTSQRSDVVVVPTGDDGDIIRIVGLDFHRGGPFPMGVAPAIGDVLLIEIDDSIADPGAPFTIADGSEILGMDGVEDVKSEVISDFYIAPVSTGNPGDGAGSTDPRITLVGVAAGMLAIDDVIGHFEHSGPDFSMVPYQDASRYAKTGDLLEFTISNDTMQHHPFHHHGFSFQPVRVIDHGMLDDDTDDVVLFEYDYDEFLDVVDVPNDLSIVVRMRLDDRPRITDDRQEVGAPAPNQRFLSGGAAGRWVFHCHLFLHASIGMISELVVVDTDRDMDGFDTSEDCDDFDDMTYPGAEECDPTKDNNCDGVIEGDTTPPVLACNVPDSIVPPDAPISFVATAVDNCDGEITPDITDYDCFKYTRWGRRIDKTNSCEVSIDGDSATILDSGGVGDNITWSATATDSEGNEATDACLVPVVNPGQGNVNALSASLEAEPTRGRGRGRGARGR